MDCTQPHDALVECACNATFCSGTTCFGQFCAVYKEHTGQHSFACKSVTDIFGSFLGGNESVRTPCSRVLHTMPSIKHCCCSDRCTDSFSIQSLFTNNATGNQTTTSLATAPSSTTLQISILSGLASVTVVIALVCLLLVYYFKVTRRNKMAMSPAGIGGANTDDGEEYTEFSTRAISSGRNGAVKMVQRSVADNIEIDKETPLGCGGYGSVFRGIWADREVAVKIFSDERAFFWEHKIMSTFNLNHRGIITFYGADVIPGELTITHYWLVTEYHPLRSLQDYLTVNAFRSKKPLSELDLDALCMADDLYKSKPRDNSKDPLIIGDGQDTKTSNAPLIKAKHRHELLRLIKSLVHGVEHLHALFNRSGVTMKQGVGRDDMRTLTVPYNKPAIAHCDLKSSNILVRADLSCCVADFGHAVYMDPETRAVMRPTHLAKMKGTNRYLPPECLSNTQGESIMSFIKQDIYSLGMVLWEVAQTCPVVGGVDHPTYNPPFHTELSISNPTAQDVERVVVKENRRPSIPEHFEKDGMLTELRNIITACWDKSPLKRPSIEDISKKLSAFSGGTDWIAPNGPPATMFTNDRANTTTNSVTPSGSDCSMIGAVTAVPPFLASDTGFPPADCGAAGIGITDIQETSI